MRSWITIVVVLASLLARSASAQVTLPFPAFSTPTILRSEVTANDTTLAATALNRTGGTMTGALTGTTITLSSTLTVSGATLLNSTLTVAGATTLGTTSVGALTLTGTVLPSVSNVRDLGSSGARMDEIFMRTADISVSLLASGTSTLVGNVDLRGSLADSTGNLTLGDAVDVSGLLTASAGVTVTGTVTATTFSGSGASLTSVPESAITDGTILARVAGTESITGNWTFAGTNTNTSVAINADGTVNAFRWGHPNAAYLNTIGALDGGGAPFICFWCYHGPTANTLRRSSGGIPPVFMTVDTSGTIIFGGGSTGSVDTDFTNVNYWTLEADGDLLPGTDGYNIGSATLGADIWARQVVLDDGSTAAPALMFGTDDDGIFRLNADEVFIGSSLTNTIDGAYMVTSAGTLGGTPTIRFHVGDGTTSSLQQVVSFTIADGILTQEIPITLDEKNTTPSSPSNGDTVRIYMRNNNLVFQFNDAGTVRYKYLDLTGTGVTWVHSTTAP